MVGKLALYPVVIMVLLIEISLAESHGNCTCGYYATFKDVGPYCYKWIDGYPPFCYLAGGEKAKNCPGAVELEQEKIYRSEDESICYRSIQPVTWSLSERPPFNVRDIVKICLYSLNLLVGTVGNALVIKYFASGDASGRPGSRFVIVLAGVDFISSIWLPARSIEKTLYHHPLMSFHIWGSGEITCRVQRFYRIIFYSLVPTSNQSGAR